MKFENIFCYNIFVSNGRYLSLTLLQLLINCDVVVFCPGAKGQNICSQSISLVLVLPEKFSETLSAAKGSISAGSI